MKTYYTYITTNPGHTTLYVGMTNDLERRMLEHHESRGNPSTFAGKYYCYKLVYYEAYSTPMEAIKREKEIKEWPRAKKLALINSTNPKWEWLLPV